MIFRTSTVSFCLCTVSISNLSTSSSPGLRCCPFEGTESIANDEWKEAVDRGLIQRNDGLRKERQRLDDVALWIAERGEEAIFSFNGQSLSIRCKAFPRRFAEKLLSIFTEQSEWSESTIYLSPSNDSGIQQQQLPLESHSQIWGKELWNEQTLLILIGVYFM